MLTVSKSNIFQIIKTVRDPVFDESFEFVISQDELANKHLEVSICEEKVIKNEDIEKVALLKVSFTFLVNKFLYVFRW